MDTSFVQGLWRRRGVHLAAEVEEFLLAGPQPQRGVDFGACSRVWCNLPAGHGEEIMHLRIFGIASHGRRQELLRGVPSMFLHGENAEIGKRLVVARVNR